MSRLCWQSGSAGPCTSVLVLTSAKRRTSPQTGTASSRLGRTLSTVSISRSKGRPRVWGTLLSLDLSPALTSRSMDCISSLQKERGPVWETPSDELRFLSIEWHPRPVLDLAKKDSSAKHAGASSPPATAVAHTPSGHGYWAAGDDGEALTFGDAVFHGDLSADPARWASSIGPPHRDTQGLGRAARGRRAWSGRAPEGRPDRRQAGGRRAGQTGAGGRAARSLGGCEPVSGYHIRDVGIRGSAATMSCRQAGTSARFRRSP